jgi:hypothetical protein
VLHHQQLCYYKADMYDENEEGLVDANGQYECANDGNQDENSRSKPTLHEKAYNSKKGGPGPKHAYQQS